MTFERLGGAFVLAAGVVALTWGAAEHQRAVGSASPRAVVKGGDDRSGEYEAVADWWKPAPNHDKTWRWGQIAGVAVDNPNRIFAVTWGDRNAEGKLREPVSNAIVVADRNGTIVETWTQYDDILNWPHQIYVNPYDPERHVWVVERGGGGPFMQVLKFTNDGQKLVMRLGEQNFPKTQEEARAKKPGPYTYGQPAVLAFLPDGSFYLGDGYWHSRVIKYTADGKYVTEWGEVGKGPGQFDVVHGLAIDRDRRVYVADRSNSRVQVFTAEGRFIEEWPNILSPAGLYIDEHESVWVLDRTLNRVLKYNKAGQLQYYWGAFGGTSGGFAGGLQRPHQFDVDQEGNVYIANFDGGYVSKFVPKPGADPNKLLGKRLILANGVEAP
jgi:DNA-binding beta-propeller fold protein YncE